MEDWQLARAESHTSSGLKSAETVALENLPDSDVKEALQQLAPDFRLAVFLADVEGFSYKEIAGIMGTPIGTVMSRLNRGRTQLRALLADYARDRGMVRQGGRSERHRTSRRAADCEHMLARVHEFLDHELDTASSDEIRRAPRGLRALPRPLRRRAGRQEPGQPLLRRRQGAQRPARPRCSASWPRPAGRRARQQA